MSGCDRQFGPRVRPLSLSRRATSRGAPSGAVLPCVMGLAGCRWQRPAARGAKQPALTTAARLALSWHAAVVEQEGHRMIPYVEIPSLHLWGPLTLQPFGFLVVAGCVVGYAVGHGYCRQTRPGCQRPLGAWRCGSRCLHSSCPIGRPWDCTIRSNCPRSSPSSRFNCWPSGPRCPPMGAWVGGPWGHSCMGSSAGCPCGRMGTPSPSGGWRAGALGAWDVR